MPNKLDLPFLKVVWQQKSGLAV